MARTRSLLTAAVAVACLAAPLAATGPSAAASAASPSAAASAPRPVVRALVSYGHRAVFVPEDSRALISFDGRRGDLVMLNGTWPIVPLLDRGRVVRPSWPGSGLYRLPRTGRFTFQVPADRYDDQHVSVMKARVHDLTVDGPALLTKPRRGFMDLAAVRLRGGDRVTVDDGRKLSQVFGPDGVYRYGFGRRLLLRPGHDLRVDDVAFAVDGEIGRGTQLVRVRSGHRVTAASAVEIPVVPDGAPFEVATDRRAAREIVLTFDASAGDLVYLDALGGPVLAGSRSMVDRWAEDGDSISLVGEPDGAADSFVVQTDGEHELSIVTPDVGATARAVARLRKGVRVADLVPDGPAVDLVLDGSGTRVYSLATESGQRLEATTRDLAAGEPWTIVMGPRSPWSCGREPGGPMGCADNWTFTLSAAALVADDQYYNPREPVAVAYPAPGTTGTVSLRLLSTTQVAP